MGWIALDGCDARPYAGLRLLEPLEQGDFALVLLDHAAAGLAQDLDRLGPHLATSLLHRRFGLPIGDGQAITGLPVSDEGCAGEALLLPEQWEDLLRPELDGLIDLVRITLESNNATVRIDVVLQHAFSLFGLDTEANWLNYRLVRTRLRLVRRPEEGGTSRRPDVALPLGYP